jgi:hypothetical protein
MELPQFPLNYRIAQSNTIIAFDMVQFPLNYLLISIELSQFSLNFHNSH